MAYVFKLISPIVKVAEGDGLLKIVGYASTVDTDRVGDVILPSAWANGGLDNFKLNPIILFNHNYSAPIGRAIEMEVDSRGLKITCEISTSAGDTYGLIKDGVLTTFSVGFMIKDADYNQVTDGYIIKDAELLEVSVVSVPCNQAATFSIAKSLESSEARDNFNKEVNALKGQEEIVVTEPKGSENEATPPKNDAGASTTETIKMTEEEIQAMAQKIADAAIAKQLEAQEIARKAAEKLASDEAKINTAAEAAAAKIVGTQEEKLTAAFEARLKANDEDFQKTFNEMKTALEEKTNQFEMMANSKRHFGDRGPSNGDWATNPALVKQADDAFLLSRITKKAFGETKVGKDLMEKVNAHSTATVSSATYELTVSTQIERDIWNELILAPLFREIQMNSAQMTFPIMPDAGYAEITGNLAASGTAPNGNMDQRGATFGSPYDGIALTEKTLSTIKMIAKSYLGNDTEEDAIMPILPLIRESMIRVHARGVENMFLAGNHADGVYTSGAANGLIKFASTNSRTVTAAGTNTALTSAALFGMRKLMGKYGIKPSDVVYIVSQQAYFELIEDPEFADADLVGSQANKLTGEVGRLYGSTVLMCDEFATPATGKYSALAVNTRNFVVPRLRGVTVESDYLVEDQRTVLVTSQRLGFDEIIPAATSVIGLKYA